MDWAPQGDCLITPAPEASTSMPRVLLPAPDEVQDPQKRQAIQELLKVLEKGLMVASNSWGLFIQRQRRCQGRVFWKGFAAPGEAASGKLERNQCQHVFDANAFRVALDHFHRHLGPCPCHQVTLCLGEELGENESMDDKLITIQMVQAFALRLQKSPVEVASISLLS
uniref:Interferon regulatory factor-3 domain-containing protein n=1 Tax=Sphenodon punctatus TaxID=8508 RepID=A0A8D0HQM6_SPHPU